MKHRIILGLCCFFLMNVGFAQKRGIDRCKEDKKKLNTRIKNLEQDNKVLRAKLEKLGGGDIVIPTPSKTRTNRTNNSAGNKNKPNKNKPNKNDLADKEKIADLRSEIRSELNTKPATLHRTIDLFNNKFDTYIVDVSNPNQQLQFFLDDKDGYPYSSLGEVKKDFENQPKELTFSMNGGMYNPSYLPQGLLIQDGVTKHALDIKKQGGGNFYLKPNGVFLINKQGRAKIVTTEFFNETKMLDNTKNATQSGPMLLIKGKYHQKFNPNSRNLNIRNGVGIIDENTIVFAISRSGVTFYDFATLFKDVFNCQDALFLDGAVSRMYCPELGRMDTGGNFGTILGLVKKK